MYSIDEIAEALKREEGYRAHCYICTAGKNSVGYGRNIDADGGIGISEDEADYLLRNDIDRTIKECEQWAWFSDLQPAQQSVLIQLCFQLGYPGLQNSNACWLRSKSKTMRQQRTSCLIVASPSRCHVELLDLRSRCGFHAHRNKTRQAALRRRLPRSSKVCEGT